LNILGIMTTQTSNRCFTQSILALAALVFFVSCGGGSTSSFPQLPTLRSISVSPQTATVAAGLTQQFIATGTYSDGSLRALDALTWSTSDSTVATVNSTGLATTLKAGNATIAAASGAVLNTAPLVVGPAIPVSISIVPANVSVKIGLQTPTKLSAILAYSDSSSTDISGSATWSVANPFIASVDSTGNVTALRMGYATVSSTSGTLSATSAFVVTGQPRYLYYMSGGGGQLVSKAIIDSASGQLRMTGNIQTGAYDSAAFPCPTTDPLNRFLYVGSYLNDGGLSGEIQIYNLDPVSGALAPVTGSPFPQTSPVSCVDFEPTGKFAYAVTLVDGSTGLLTFSADPITGALTLLTSTNLAATPTRPAVDPIGKYLYLAAFSGDFSAASAFGFDIDPSTGVLTPIAGTPFALTNITGTFSFHPSGNFLYMANTNGGSIDTYSVDRSTGKLTAAGTISTCGAPTTVRFSPNGNYAYVACSTSTAASVESYAVGSNGSLTHLGSAPSDGAAFDLTVDPSGQFLYLCEISNYIHIFQAGSDGIAKSVGRIGVQPNPGRTMVALGGASVVHYTPKAAYITSTGDNTFSSYRVNTDGTLTLQQSVPTNTSFSSLSLWPWGTDVAMASAIAKPNLLSFPLSSSTSLPGPGFPFGDAVIAGGVAIDPSGQFAFETDSAKGVIYTYDKSGSSWALVTYGGTPPFNTFNAGGGAGPISLDPSGLLVYVANQTDNSISAYQHWGSPELFESKGQFVIPYTDGSPFSIGATPLRLAIDPNEAFLYVLCSDQTLRAFAIDYNSGGHIAQVTSVPLAASPSGLAVEPKGQFVYTSDSIGVKAFSVDATSGALSPVTLNPAITFANITGVYAEPAGQYLYVTTGAQNVAGAVYAYSIGSTGNLTAISTQPVATPLLPSSMAFGDDIR
jgi:6-phosphogluconolactonase